MTSTSRLGTAPQEGIKAPVRVETDGPITLSAEQTINGVAVVSGDRVLVKDQASTEENGIYCASSSSWTRATDFNAADDVVAGQLVMSRETGLIYKVIVTDPVVIGSDPVTFGFALTDAAAAILAQEWAENAEDDDVTGYAGQFSALHHSAKAADQVTLAADQVALAAAQVTLAADQVPLAAAAGTAAGIAAAEPFADLAQEWAENPEDDAVTGYPGQFSALHHSAKAQDQVALAAGQVFLAGEKVDEAEVFSDLAQEWAEKPEDTAVTGNPTGRSALHHSAKAEGFKDEAEAAAGVAAAEATSAESSANTAIAAAEASGNVVFYDTHADATAALGGLSEGQVVRIWVDETKSDSSTYYVVESAALVFKVYALRMQGRTLTDYNITAGQTLVTIAEYEMGVSSQTYYINNIFTREVVETTTTTITLTGDAIPTEDSVLTIERFFAQDLGSFAASNVTHAARAQSVEDTLNDMGEVDVYTAFQSKQEFDAAREIVRNTHAASGFVEVGKASINGTYAGPPNVDGLNFYQGELHLGRTDGAQGDSRTQLPVINCDGILFDLKYIGSAVNGAAITRWPDAPNDETLFTRQDLVFLEPFDEVISGGTYHPYGCLGSGVTTVNGVSIPLDPNKAATYHAMGVWDTAALVGRGKDWDSTSDADKKAIAAVDKTVYYDADTGQYVQWKIRLRVVPFSAAENDYSVLADELLICRKNWFGTELDGTQKYCAVQGDNDTPSGGADLTISIISAFGDTHYNPFTKVLGPTDYGTFLARTPANFSVSACYAIPIGLVRRYNTGAYHPYLNEYGTAKFKEQVALTELEWWEVENGVANSPTITTTADCFVAGNIIGGDAASTISGRPEGAVYHDQPTRFDYKDLRPDAKKYDFHSEFERRRAKLMSGTMAQYEHPIEFRGDLRYVFTRTAGALTGTSNAGGSLSFESTGFTTSPTAGWVISEAHDKTKVKYYIFGDNGQAFVLHRTSSSRNDEVSFDVDTVFLGSVINYPDADILTELETRFPVGTVITVVPCFAAKYSIPEIQPVSHVVIGDYNNWPTELKEGRWKGLPLVMTESWQDGLPAMNLPAPGSTHYPNPPHVMQGLGYDAVYYDTSAAAYKVFPANGIDGYRVDASNRIRFLGATYSDDPADVFIIPVPHLAMGLETILNNEKTLIPSSVVFASGSGNPSYGGNLTPATIGKLSTNTGDTSSSQTVQITDQGPINHSLKYSISSRTHEPLTINAGCAGVKVITEGTVVDNHLNIHIEATEIIDDATSGYGDNGQFRDEDILRITDDNGRSGIKRTFTIDTGIVVQDSQE